MINVVTWGINIGDRAGGLKGQGSDQSRMGKMNEPMCFIRD